MPRYTPEPPKLTQLEQTNKDHRDAAEARKRQAEQQGEQYRQNMLDIAARATATFEATKAEEERQAAAQLVADKEAEMRNAALQSYIETTGSDAGFTLLWPSLQADIIRQETLAGLGNAKPVTNAAVVKKTLALHYGQG